MIMQKVKASEFTAAITAMRMDTMSGRIRHCGRTRAYK